MAFGSYYYDNQLARWLKQCVAIFGNLKVATGKNDTTDSGLISVPICYGSRDRVVASILGKNTQNRLLKLPIMSLHMSSLLMAPELRKGIGGERRTVTMPAQGVFPDDIKVDHQYMPVPYKMGVELSIYCSNNDQQFQILEQILMLFDPIVQIQTSDAQIDWTRITTVELTGIQLLENYPQGIERRMIQAMLSFELPVYISAPTDVRSDFIKDVYLRIGAIGLSTPNEDILAELDAQGAQYELVASGSDLGV